MTYQPELLKLKMSIFMCYITNGQSGFSSSTWTACNLSTSHTILNDPFGDNISINGTNDYITLPAGKYYINARVGAYYNGHKYSECAIFNYDTSEMIGFSGQEHTYLDYNKNPAKSEHAKAYIESDSEIKIQLRARASHSSLELSRTAPTQGSAYPRILVYRLE